MLRTRMDFSRMAGRLLLQVAASVTATLIGSAIFGTLPRIAPQGAPAMVELTSGGKYAARIPGAAPDLAQVVAEARSAAVPVPAESPAAGLLQPGLLPQPSLLPALELAWDEALPAELPSPEKPVRGKSRPIHAEPRRTVEAAASASRRPADAVAASVAARPVGPSAGDNLSLVGEGGLLPRVVSSARSIWSLSASAGGSLISHLTP